METVEDYIETINKIITFNKEDTLSNHIKTFVRFYGLEYCGNVKTNEFKIWKRSRSIGAFYYVIKGIVIIQNNEPKLILKTKMNILGTIMKFIILGLLGFGIISGMLSLTDFSWSFIWKDLLFILSILILSCIFTLLIFSYHRKELIDSFAAKLKTFANIV